MAELRDEHFEVISENKARAHEQQKDMRDELSFFVIFVMRMQFPIKHL